MSQSESAGCDPAEPEERDQPPQAQAQQQVVRRTVQCLLCGGVHLYPGPRLENHLLNEHGAIFDTKLLIELSVYKSDYGVTPSFEGDAKQQNDAAKAPDENKSVKEEEVAKEEDAVETSPSVSVPTRSIETQTDDDPMATSSCARCEMSASAVTEKGVNVNLDLEEEDDDLLMDDDTMMDESMDDEDILAADESDLVLRYDGDDDNDPEEDIQLVDGKLLCWPCPNCPRIMKTQRGLQEHGIQAHNLDQESLLAVDSVLMTPEEVEEKNKALNGLTPKVATESDPQDSLDQKLPMPTPASTGGDKTSFMVDKSKRRPLGKEWGPNSFSSFFTCYFCNEQFRKDYKLKLHLMLNHKNESVEDMAKAKEELTKGKLDGCVHKCAMCGSKYNSVANFTRHIKDMHGMGRAQYREEYGSSEVVSKMFKCELCEKEIKHTRNIIGAHMKMVHLISWREYQEILIRLRQGEVVGDLPAPELFQCSICGVSVKYKREHLNKKHQISEDLYDELVEKKERGEDISAALPEREIFRCAICDRECMDIKKHIERAHQITEEVYQEMLDGKQKDEASKPLNGFSPAERKKRIELTPKTEVPTSSSGLSTDLQCYFGCDESFKKDYQLYLHLKMRHRHEPDEELKKAYDAADEEIALTRRSGSVYQCALCPKQFSDNGAFYGHIQTKHTMRWTEYKAQYGRCEVESAPFECLICLKVIKYDRNTVHTHLKNVHGINWQIYLDRVRKVRRGETPDELPEIEVTECKVCSVNVKYLRDHLKNVHKITEEEYRDLFKEESTNGTTAPTAAPQTPLAKPPKADIQNRANKTCSSCNASFETRRAFIEHCTIVHKMKFKTKSGFMITAPKNATEPPVAQAQPPPPLKRMILGEVSVDSTPRAAKMARYQQFDEDELSNVQDTSGSMPSATLHGGPQYTPNGVSKWNQCRYECCFCKRSTMSRSSMTSHIHNTHGLPIQEYKKQNYPDIEVETNWFTCRICNTRTKFVKDCISPHLKMSHNMDIEVYEQEYMQPEDWPNHKKAEDMAMRELNNEDDDDDEEEQEMNEPVTVTPAFTELAASEGLKVDKWNKCQYRCCLCEWSSLDSRQMRTHIATAHGLAYDQYVAQYGTAEVVTVKFRCELCNSVMKHCRQNIYTHMKDVHKLKLHEYEERVGLAEEEEALGLTQLHQPSQAMPPPPPVDPGTSASRWNKCRFQCFLCKKISSEKRHIREHVVKAHGMSMPDYETQYGDCEIHTEYFFCGICHAEVKHNLKNISLHLNNVHGMNTSEYEEQFGRMPEQSTQTHQQPPPTQPAALMHHVQGDLGFGSHFLLDKYQEALEGEDEYLEEGMDSLPPKADVFNTKCKFCRVCNKEFSRRQVFLDHCRNIHQMNVAFNTGSQAQVTRSPQGTNGSSRSAVKSHLLPHKCEYCGKQFSNRSNRNRHALLSCDKNPRTGVDVADLKDADDFSLTEDETAADESYTKIPSAAVPKSRSCSRRSEDYELIPPTPEKTRSYPQKCPVSGCDTTTLRSALMKRHLFDAHSIQNVSVQLKDNEKMKESPLDFPMEENDLLAKNGNSNKDEEKKVPPLRVRIIQSPKGDSGENNNPASNTPKAERERHVANTEVRKCPHCSVFKTKNLYIFGKHERACQRKMQAAEAASASEAKCPQMTNGDSSTENKTPLSKPNDDDEEPRLKIDEGSLPSAADCPNGSPAHANGASVEDSETKAN